MNVKSVQNEWNELIKHNICAAHDEQCAKMQWNAIHQSNPMIFLQFEGGADILANEGYHHRRALNRASLYLHGRRRLCIYLLFRLTIYR